MKKIFKTIINIVLIAILIYSGYNIYDKLNQYKKADKTYTEARAEKKETLKNKNPDFKFWLKVDNTNIDYPVVQSNDNKYYLNKDFYNQDSSSGSIFMDYRDNPNSQNTILYGHNMRNKTMFNNLLKFKDADFFNQNNKIRIIKNNKEYIYEVFSAYTIDAGYDYLIPNFSNPESFKKYIKDIREKSLFKSNLDVNTKDKLITLSTCSYEFDDARTVVHGKLINN
ncbi:MAG: class B sortase [Paraclostridium sp.]|uniref:class B sortase n=1 Tax=Paraclostridium sp. TaxID=2023273 RepID=UPI003F3BC1D1